MVMKATTLQLTALQGRPITNSASALVSMGSRLLLGCRLTQGRLTSR